MKKKSAGCRVLESRTYRRSHSGLRVLPLILSALLLALTSTSHAQATAPAPLAPAPQQPAPLAPAPPEPAPLPMIFESGYQGLLSGAAVGLAGGYLAARRDDFQRKDWRALGLGFGIGALAGAGLGITLGLADRAGATGARYVARDLSLGCGFGLVLGTIAGGISALVRGDAEHVLFGASIGVIAGAGIGVVTGIVERQTRRRRAPTTAVSTGLTVRPTFSVAQAPAGGRSHTLLPGLIGQF